MKQDTKRRDLLGRQSLLFWWIIFVFVKARQDYDAIGDTFIIYGGLRGVPSTLKIT